MTSLTGPRSSTGNFSGDIIPKGYRSGQMQKFTPEQMQLFQQMFGDVGSDSYLSRLAGGDQSLFQEMEAPALRQFGELQGGLASRFSGMGLGARNSSGFQNTMNQATSSFAQDLAGKRQDLQRQAMMDLASLRSNLLSQSPYERFLTKKAPKKKSFWESLLGVVSPAGGDIYEGDTQNTQNFLQALMAMG